MSNDRNYQVDDYSRRRSELDHKFRRPVDERRQAGNLQELHAFSQSARQLLERLAPTAGEKSDADNSALREAKQIVDVLTDELDSALGNKQPALSGPLIATYEGVELELEVLWAMLEVARFEILWLEQFPEDGRSDWPDHIHHQIHKRILPVLTKLHFVPQDERSAA